MAITIEKATAADATDILAYLKQAGSETDNLTFGAEGVPFTAEQETVYLRQIADSCDTVMLVAKDKGRIIGTASLSRLSLRRSHRGDFSISVLKEYWNKGIGSMLLCTILNFARENSFDYIDLQVRSDNHSAIHLYEKYGFQKIGTHPAFFKINNADISFDYMYLKLD